jgi:ATP-dependent RNA helicase DDX1
MVFCRTNLDCQNLSKFLTQYSNQATGIHTKSGGKVMVNKYSHRILGGILSMEERRENLQLFKENEIRILICTDIASRGIDVDGLPYVVNMTLPDEIDDYIHRVGRVGRSDRMGLAISLVSTEAQEKVWFHTCKNRGKDCSNRQLVENKGCTIWYNEVLLLAKIEKKINRRISFMTTTFELPEELATQKIIYGISIINQQDETSKKIYMTDNMVANIRNLMEMEMKSQNIFLSSMFANCLK